MALRVTSKRVYDLQCDCGADLGNPDDGSLNWDGGTQYGQTVTCHVCNKTHKLPKALRSLPVSALCVCGHGRWLHYVDEKNLQRVERCDNCTCMNYVQGAA